MIKLINDDFPAPFGPMIDKISPYQGWIGALGNQRPDHAALGVFERQRACQRRQCPGGKNSQQDGGFDAGTEQCRCQQEPEDCEKSAGFPQIAETDRGGRSIAIAGGSMVAAPRSWRCRPVRKS